MEVEKKTRKIAEGLPCDASREDLIDALGRAERKIARLKTAEKRRRQSNEMLQRITYDLRERVKELNCLYRISNLVENQDNSLEEILQATVDLMPEAWQYPEITCSRIALKERTFQTANFQDGPWKQTRNIKVHGKVAGVLEIIYREERPPKDEGPFLKEERNLINMIAESIGEIIERKKAAEALRKSEEQNRAILNAIPDLMFQMDGHGTILGLHEGKFSELTPLIRELVGKHLYYLCDKKKVLPRRVLEQGMIYVKQTILTGKTHFYEQHILLNGIGRDFEVRIGVSRDNEVLGIVRDITHHRRLEREILEVSGREQRRIGQDLHDSLCQHLAGIGFLSKALEKKMGATGKVDPAYAAEIVDLIDQAITLTRGFARGLNPVRLEAGGLMLAFSELASNAEKFFGITCRFSCAEPIVVEDNAMATHLYRIVQEALNNAIKHGKADHISITLTGDEKNSSLTVKDDGLGFNWSSVTGKGMGLNIMGYRASMIGASLDIRNGEDGGTLLVCTFPKKER